MTFPFQAKPKGLSSHLHFPASPWALPPGPLQAAQPPPACMGAGCQQGPPVMLTPSPHPGTYLTHEAKGSDDAPDADTAIINAEGGQASGDDKKEYFI